MEHRRLGGTDVEVSRIILGCGNFGGIGSAPEFFGKGESEAEAFRIMDAAWEFGIDTFDTADAYGGGRSETMIGRWMASRGVRPTLTTKTFNPMDVGEDHGLARKRVGRQLSSSLDRLGVDSVDLFLAHEFDPDVPAEELAGTFAALLDTQLIKAWGVSNFNEEQLRALLAYGTPGAVQNSYSLLDRADEDGLLQLCVEHDIAYTPFSPLAGGWLTGKYKRGEPAPAGSRMGMRPEPYEHLQSDRIYDGLERFGESARRHGVDAATLAIAWLLAQSWVTAVVVGPRTPKHLEPPLRALEAHLSQPESGELAVLFE
jgi:aryl-alcohol dehydrogenase-like predicted oxidoreductase